MGKISRARELSRKRFDIRSSEVNCKQLKKLINDSKFGDKKLDPYYGWFLDFLINTNGQINTIKEGREEYKNEYDAEDEDEDEDDNYIDPQYCLFLKNLTGNGKSYKLKISQIDETRCFLEYEESDVYKPPTDTNIGMVDDGDNANSSNDSVPMQIDHTVKSSLHLENGKNLTIEGGLKKRKINVHKSITEPNFITADSCYQWLLDGYVPSDYEGKQVKYEETATSSDSEILMWENVKDCSELKDKLMLILRKPYDDEEYEELLKYAEQKKPICRLLPLRCRAISSALVGATKSVLDDVPSIRRKLKDARNDRPRALNLLRMLRFWLEHLPNKDAFKPWADEECLNVRPSTRT